MVCELFSVGDTIIRPPESFKKQKLFTQTTDLLSWLYPRDFIHQIIILQLFCYIVCYAVGFLYVCSTAMFYTKIQGDQILGFFMYLLFLGIVQNNTMKLDDALTQIGKLCFGKFWVIWCFFPNFLPRAFHWNGITGLQNSLQVQELNSKLELFHSLFVYRAKSWYTV